MLELCRRPLESCFGADGADGAGNRNGDDLVWQTKLRTHAFGDYSMAVVQANAPLEDQGQVLTSPSLTFIGVYDGHGGPHASRFINNNLFSNLQSFVSERGGLSAEVIRKAFHATEEAFLELVKKSWSTNPQIAMAGSCCLVAAISDDKMYIANLGDSRAVLGRKISDGGMFNLPEVVAERLTFDHNVGNEQVRKEVRDLHPDDSHIVVYTRGFWRIKGIIQVSRSIGDVYLKSPEFSNVYQKFGSSVTLRRAVITAEPSISVRKINPEDQFLIFASDGLWEQLSDEEAVEIVFRNPRSGIAKRLLTAAMQEAARKRGIRYEALQAIEKGVRRYFHDDILVIVVYLDNIPNSPRGKIEDNSLFDFSVTPIDVFSCNSNEYIL